MAVAEVQSGLEGVVAFATEIAEPDKEGGSLRYRGVDIDDLVGKVPFEKVWGLLVDGAFDPGMPPAVLACLLPRLSLFQPDDPDPTLADPVVLAALRDSGNTATGADSDNQYTVVSITATAVLAGGARFVRHAVIGIGPSPTGGWSRVLDWTAPPP